MAEVRPALAAAAVDRTASLETRTEVVIYNIVENH